VYSGQLEAFGMLTILCFVSNYLSNYPNTYPMATGITIYCNNQGIINCIHQLAKITPIMLQSTMDDDYNIYMAIHMNINKVQPVNITLRHIKGHQDQQPNKKYLSLACLNIECNQQAVDYLKIARKLHSQKNPPIPHSYPL